MNGGFISPLGVYIHIPFCKSKCKYCAFVSVSDFSLQKKYVDALLGEIKGSLERGLSVDTVYIGGGTPSCLYRGALNSIFSALRSAFDVMPDAEITVECNPESVSEAFVDECLKCGVNRISMGLQSSCDEILRKIGRVHDFSAFLRAAEMLSHNFSDISSDMILGLPGQTKEDVDRCVEVFSKYCTHASVYALTVEEGTTLYKSGYCPDDDFVAELYDYAVSALNCSGFKRYEVSNFARDGKRSKHNGRYWSLRPYLGFGVAAHGYDGWAKRTRHSDDLYSYIETPTATEIPLSRTDMYNEYVMLRLRTDDGISFKDFTDRFGFRFEEFNREKIDNLCACGYIRPSEKGIVISPEYMFVMNGIIEELMADDSDFLPDFAI